MGNSPEDLEYIEDNPFFRMKSYEHTNDPRVIARHEHMLTFNGALMVDLSGQIGVYAIGPRVYSGTGGQLAFHLGASMARQGRACTVLPSTARGGDDFHHCPAVRGGANRVDSARAGGHGRDGPWHRQTPR